MRSAKDWEEYQKYKEIKDKLPSIEDMFDRSWGIFKGGASIVWFMLRCRYHL